MLAASASGGLVGVLTACAGATAEQPAGGFLDTATKHDITFWPRNVTDQIAFEAMLPFVKQLFPNLTVNFEIPSGSLLEKLKVTVAAGTPPDGFVMGLGSARYLAAQKLVPSIQDYLKRDKEVQTNLKSFAQATVQAYTFDDQLHAIPATNEGIVLWYNRDAFAEAKLPFPRDIEDDPAKWNWNTVVDMARALNRGSGPDRQRYGLMVTGRKTVAFHLGILGQRRVREWWSIPR